MSIAQIQLQLMIGQVVPSPAPPELMNALQSVEVTQSEQSGFQISFRVGRGAYVSADYTVVSHPLLKPGNRVIINVTVGAMPRVIMDGIITHHQFSYGNNGAALLTVTGEDISVLMDVFELPMEYPGLGDWEIANFVLAKYSAFGIIPTVLPPLNSVISLPTERIPQQSTSDRAYLRALAAEHGYIFFVQPGPLPLQNVAYWGPITRIGLPQKALTVDAGPATNVQSINFSYDALAPTQVFGAVSDEELETVLPVVTIGSTRLPPFASMPALIFNQPFVRKSLFDYQGSSYLDAQMRAQMITDQSVANVVSADGSLDVLRYGDVLAAPGLVAVRGAGFSYDGYYYVKSVTHHISLGQYTQDFSLAREGLGSTTTGVTA